jgi:putative oxidoreductase
MFGHPIVNHLIGAALQGEKKWEWAPILLARVSLGLFFAISGWNKLFVEKNKAGLLEVMHEIGIPFPEFFAVLLASVEFFGGSLLTVGLLSAFCGIALAFAMVVAIATVEVHTIPAGLSFLNWLDYFLYLPQVMYVILFAWLLVSGPGPISIDHLLARKLGVAAGQEQATAGRIGTLRERTELQ